MFKIMVSVCLWPSRVINSHWIIYKHQVHHTSRIATSKHYALVFSEKKLHMFFTSMFCKFLWFCVEIFCLTNENKVHENISSHFDKEQSYKRTYLLQFQENCQIYYPQCHIQNCIYCISKGRSFQKRKNIFETLSKTFF